MTTNFPSGVHTVLVTPFTSDDNVDYDSLSRLVDMQIASQVSGLVLLGTTSESPVLSTEESVKIVKFVSERVGYRKFITAGIGGNNTRNVVEFGNQVKEFCDGFMVTVPCYNKPDQEGIFKHFLTVSSAFPTHPIIMYNIPSRTGVNMTAETTTALYESCENIVAIKEASGSMDQISDVARLSDIKLFAGDDGLVIPTTSVGGVGVISVASNIIPTLVCKTYELAASGDYSGARDTYTLYADLVKLLFVATNPVPVKLFLQKLGLIEHSDVRLPLCKPRNSDDLVSRFVALELPFEKCELVTIVVDN